MAGKTLTVNQIDSAVYGIDAVLDQINGISDLAGIAIDAPLIINNAPGQRPCEKEIGRKYGSRYASCHTSNTTLYPEAASVYLSRCMLDTGFQHLKGSRWQIECYPHPAIIEIFGLKERLKYKKGKGAEKREGQKALAVLLSELSRSSELKLAFDRPTQKYLHLDYIESLEGQELKSNEDALDAIVCLYIAGLYAIDFKGRTFGEVDSGYIRVPGDICIDPAGVDFSQLQEKVEFAANENKNAQISEEVSFENTQQLLRDAHSFIHQRETLTDELEEYISENYKELEDRGCLFVWSHLYEVPLKDVILFAAGVVGIEEETTGMLEGEVSTEKFLVSYAKCINEIITKLDEDEFDYTAEETQVVRILFACNRIINANYASQVKYGKSMQKLLSEVFFEENEESLYAAVDIDKSVLSCKASGKLIADAVLGSNGMFFDKLSRAIKGSYSTKGLGPIDVNLREMLMVEQDLVNKGEIKRLADLQAYEFYVNDRQLYSDDLDDSFGSFIQARKRFRRGYERVKDKKM